eukprot:CAMPEP_0197452844 /NCGR_PEP_ID=MMETSP1175-20131217/33224_1 /TAXON_ID=1003142 /ORGANISM="Triceratium dubium, Strain CCMP147" /LENGTH=152 /DNA_ID=CAMNT_0042985949 /DNA_START=358 /DNA_END=814 /DNA_ORIENTATION=+
MTRVVKRTRCCSSPTAREEADYEERGGIGLEGGFWAKCMGRGAWGVPMETDDTCGACRCQRFSHLGRVKYGWGRKAKPIGNPSQGQCRHPYSQACDWDSKGVPPSPEEGVMVQRKVCVCVCVRPPVTPSAALPRPSPLSVLESPFPPSSAAV